MLGRKPSAFLTNSSTGLSKLLSRCTWEQVEQENFPMKTLHFLVPTVRESFHFFSKVVWLGCRNCIPAGNSIILRRGIRCDFPPDHFRTLRKTPSGFFRIFINWVVKTAFLVSRSVLCVEHLLQESCRVLFITCGFSDKKICFLAEK